jgi:outer membrane lipoprotein carrier protein
MVLGKLSHRRRLEIKPLNEVINMRNTLAALVAACLVVSTTASGQSPTRHSDLQQLDSFLQGIETLAADVVQLIVESDGGVLEESSIKMYLMKPDGFYWETLSPFPELVVTNGRLLWNYQPDLEQVVIERWDSSRSELAVQLLNGQTEDLAAEYVIENVSLVGDEHQEFTLTPMAADSIYDEISINFLLSELNTIYLENKNGQQTVWRFENVVRNQPMDDEIFEFQPPDNIEVIENTYTR